MRRTPHLLAALALAGPALAADIQVDPSGNGDFLSIQGAIDFATDGDRILVNPGDYVEELYISGKLLTIEGVSGKDLTRVLSPGMPAYGGQLVSVLSQADVTLRGIAFDAAGERRTILVGYDSNLVLDDTVVANGENRDGFPGGLLDLFVGSTATATFTLFESGDASGGVFPYGGCIGVEDSSAIVLGDGVIVHACRAVRGGGLWLDQGATADIWRAAFTANTAAGFGDNDGGGVCAERGSNLSIDETDFDGNQAGMDGASYGGGLYSATGFVQVVDSSFVGNSAHMGGGIAVEDGSLVVRGGTFSMNGADKGASVGCASSPICGVVGASHELQGAQQGGAVYGWNGATALVGNSFCENTATDPAAGVLADGGAVRQAEGSLFLRNNVFVRNTANSDGGAVAVTDAILDSQNNHFLENQAGAQGGAIHALDTLGFFAFAHSVNDLQAYNSAAVNGGISFGAGLGSSVDYGWFYLNAPGPGTIGLALSNTVGLDPELSGWQAGDCDTSGMPPAPWSPLIDGGDPAILDPDGTVSDIGAFGGPLADGGASDLDGDGVITALDCDDGDAAVGYPRRWHPDADGDGFGDSGVHSDGCMGPAGWITDGTDCDDADPTINPQTLWYWDWDGDGYGDPTWAFEDCDPGPYFVQNGDDCNDYDPTIHIPGIWYVDGDGDGYGREPALDVCDPPPGSVLVAGDCNDDDQGVHPGRLELCDGVDQDCDGAIDDGAVDGRPLHPDADGDGFGDPVAILTCAEDGFTEDGTDCDDQDPEVHPGAPDAWYDGIDADCDGRDDFDADGDGYPLDTDCEDGDHRIHPGATDRYDDGIDSDCDGVDSRTWIAGGSGCSTTGSGPGAPAWPALLLLVLVRLRWRP